MQERRTEDDDDNVVSNPDAVRPSGRSRKLVTRLNISSEFRFDYKDPQMLRYFVSERGKILPRRMTGLSARQQRDLVTAIKRARNIALLPFTAPNPGVR